MALTISYGPSLAELNFVFMDLFSRNDTFHADRQTAFNVFDPEDGETEAEENMLYVSVTSARILNVADQVWQLKGKVLIADNQIGIWRATYSTKTRKGTFEILSAEDAWVKLSDLRPGALFVTEDGVRAVKSEHYYTATDAQCQCVLVESGEYAHFLAKNETLVRELHI